MSFLAPGKSGRSRSKSPGGGSRSRSRSRMDDARAPSPPPTTGAMPGGYAAPAHQPNHSLGQPYPSHDMAAGVYMPQPAAAGGSEWNNDGFAMDWNDLPPQSRPSVATPYGANPKKQVPHAQADFSNISYAPGLVPQFANYKVTEGVANSGSRGRAYSQSGNGKEYPKIKMTSKPVTRSQDMGAQQGYNATSMPVNYPQSRVLPPPLDNLPYPPPGGMPGMPGMPGMFGMPGMPGAPGVPEVGGGPGMSMPNMPTDPLDFSDLKVVEPSSSKKHRKGESKHENTHDSTSHFGIPSPPMGDRIPLPTPAGMPPPPPPVSGIPPPPMAGTWPQPGSVPFPPGPDHLSVNGQAAPFGRAPSPGLHGEMDRLSVNGNGHHIRPMTPGHAPPASPLLEAYQGTYQSMRSPLLMPHFDDDLDDLPPLSHYDSHKSKKKSRRVRHADQDDSSSSSSEKARKKMERRSSSETKIKIKSSLKAPKSRSNKTSYSHTDSKPARSPSGRRVTMYDAERDAKTIAEALSHTRPDMEPLVEILPLLSHDQVMELRAAYKKVCKIQGRGINIAKHVKMKTSGPLGKLLYVLALGRWESEGYWANFWYNSNSSRRELLIEALMGRTNQEIKLIKADFQDKRYDDSLVKCMDKELKADKFRTAVLQALEEKRQEESEVWPLEYRNRDVDALREALRRKEGGETALLVIVVTRSDAHLRDVLRTYERKFGSNFAKDALKKSNNLVGEIVAHILNGVINRPARDALLLNHALMDLSSAGEDGTKVQDRVELLISRLVRMHWDKAQFQQTKQEYRAKYRRHLEDDVEKYVRGEDMREACLNLCEAS